MSAGAQTVRYILEVAGDTSGATASVRDLDGTMASLKQSVSAVSAVVAAAGVALVGMRDHATETVDQVHTLAASSGLAADTVNGLRLRADATGKTLEQLIPPELAKRIQEAKTGTGEAARGFDLLGIQAAIMRGELSSADEVLRASIDALMLIEDPTTRAAAATMALGEQGKQLLSAFENTSQLEAFIELGRELGTDVGPEAAAAASEWQQRMARLNLSLEESSQRMIEVGNSAGWLIDAFSTGLVGSTTLVTEALNNGTGAMANIRDGILGIFSASTLAEDELARSQLGQGLIDIYGGGVVKALSAAQGAMSDEIAAHREAADAAEEHFQAYGPFLDEVGAMAAAKDAETAATKAAADAHRDAAAAVREADAIWEQSARRWASIQARQKRDEVRAAEEAVREADSIWDESAKRWAAIQARQKEEAEGEGEDDGEKTTLRGVMGMLQGIINFPRQVQALLKSIQSIVEDLPDILVEIPQIVIGIIDAIVGFPSALIEAMPKLIGGFVKAIWKLVTLFPRMFLDILTLLPEKITKGIADALTKPLKDKDGNFLGTNLTAKKGDKKLFGLSLPFFDTGGDVERTGLAVVHKGERVLNRKEVSSGRGGEGSRFQLNFYGAIHASGPGDLMRNHAHFSNGWTGGPSLLPIGLTA